MCDLFGKKKIKELNDILRKQNFSLAHLRSRNAKLLLEKKTPWVTDSKMVSRNELVALFHENNIEAYSLKDPLDMWFSITTKDELDRIAPYFTYPADFYVQSITDCEDYGLKAQVDACFDAGVSGIRLCLGDIPLGYHGFVITVDTESNIWLLEPNAGFPFAGEWFAIGENGYIPQKVLI